MKKFFQSKGFIVSSLALLCVTILGVCWFVSRDRTGDFIPTGRTMQSGFCTYPEYRFRANRLQELDPEGYAGYLKNFERRCSA